MKIFVKFPSRERAQKFNKVLSAYIEMSSQKDISYLITLDKNCPEISMYISFCEDFKKRGVDLNYVVGESESKIHAINRDMEESGKWDILVLASDDMICQVQNWDLVLRNEMESHFPNTDGVLFHKDGKTQLNTMCILGRTYYNQFGYIYNPDYISLWCDNEFMEVSRILKKEKVFEQVLFAHEHYSTHRHIQMDALMQRTQRFYHQDESTYKRRKQLNFNINV